MGHTFVAVPSQSRRSPLIALHHIRDCYSCSQNKCVAKEGSKHGGGGASKGALAGGVIGALILLAIAVGGLMWYRRNNRLRSIATPEVKDRPAAAEDVLNRPDPAEKAPANEPVRVYAASYHTVLEVDNNPQSSTHPARYSQSSAGGTVRTNPFDDKHSIQTAVTEGTNVIPIALVASHSHRPSTSQSDLDAASASVSPQPVRPTRSPDLDINLNLEHVNVSHDNLRPVAPSMISGISRNSFMSGASYSSDFLNEAPMIITPTRGTIHQILGVVKAEVINAPPTPSTPDALKPPSSFGGRPSTTSPLASTSFGPNDVVHEVDEGQEHTNPFSDTHSTKVTVNPASPTVSVSTFGPSAQQDNNSDANWSPRTPNVPWSQDDLSRPGSVSTQPGSIADIANATRVNLGLSQMLNTPLGFDTFPPSPNMPVGTRLNAGSNTTAPNILQEQQKRALAHAQAQSHGINDRRRISGSSVVSAASTRADSILESFPFVPPSPISDRPARSPPVSPLAQQSFTAAPPSPLAQHLFDNSAHKVPVVIESAPSPRKDRYEVDDLPQPPNRKTLGLSTGSQLSTASTGLGSFPFHIDAGAMPDNSSRGVASVYGGPGRQRASLDTLALTSDLASYPLNFDRDSVPPVPKRP